METLSSIMNTEEDLKNGDVKESDDISVDGPDADAIKMFVGQIPRTWTETELRLLFDQFGPVYQLSVLRDKATGESRGCCFITFYHRKDAIACQGTLHNIKILPGMHHPIQMKPADSENRNERKLFVGMISKKINESDVKSLFASFGVIEDCSVLRDSTGNSRGCAFVTFSSRAAALNAIKIMHHSRTMEGCSMPLVVKFADTQKDKDQKKLTGTAVSQSPGTPAAAVGLMPLTGAAASASPTLRHSALLSAGSPMLPYLGMGLPHLMNSASATGGGLSSQSGTFPLLANQAALTGMNPSAAVGSLNSLAGYYGLNSNLANATGNTASTVNGVAALINYLLTTAAVSSAAGVNTVGIGGGLPGTTYTAVNHTPSQVWKPPSLTSPTALTSPALNNLMQLTAGGGAAAAAYLSQAYAATGATIPFAAATASSPLGTTAAGPSTKQMEGPEGANLFIYHLPQEFTDADLAQTFAPFGSVLSAKVFVDKQTNLSKCFGFVSYESPTSAHTAIQAMNGFQIGMKRLKVQLKRSKQDSKPYQHPDNAKI